MGTHVFPPQGKHQDEPSTVVTNVPGIIGFILSLCQILGFVALIFMAMMVGRFGHGVGRDSHIVLFMRFMFTIVGAMTIASLALSIIGLNKKYESKGFATAGVAISGATLLIGILLLLPAL